MLVFHRKVTVNELRLQGGLSWLGRNRWPVAGSRWLHFALLQLHLVGSGSPTVGPGRCFSSVSTFICTNWRCVQPLNLEPPVTCNLHNSKFQIEQGWHFVNNLHTQMSDYCSWHDSLLDCQITAFLPNEQNFHRREFKIANHLRRWLTSVDQWRPV